MRTKAKPRARKWERGIESEAEAKERLRAAHRQFMSEGDPGQKLEAGKGLIRAIFGTEAIAEDSVR